MLAAKKMNDMELNSVAGGTVVETIMEPSTKFIDKIKQGIQESKTNETNTVLPIKPDPLKPWTILEPNIWPKPGPTIPNSPRMNTSGLPHT